MIKVLLFLALIPLSVLLFSSQPLAIPLRTDRNVPFINLTDINLLCPDLEVIFDTGSSDLWLADISCTNCPKRSINCMEWINTNNMNPKEIHYASGWVKGYEIDYQLCGIPTRIVCVTKAQNISNFNSDGVLGVGGNETGKQFINKLFALKPQKQVSIMNRRYSKSMIFMGLEEQLMDDKYLDSKAMKVQADEEWNIILESVMIGKEVVGKDVIAMVDTGSELISLPQRIYSTMFKIAESVLGTSCQDSKIGITCKCYSSYDILRLPLITVSFLNTNRQMETISVPPARYGIWRGKHCILLLTQINMLGNKIVLGSPFLNQYPITLDFNTHSITIISLSHPKLNRVENINFVILLTLVICVVLGSSRVCVEVVRHLDEPNKLII